MSEADPETNGNSGETIAILLICRECGVKNWRRGPRFSIMCDYVEQNFECEGCGRQLETGD